jgi:hypothetical protein
MGGTQEEDPLLKPQRTTHREHWTWATRKRRELFEDTVYSMFDQFCMGHKSKSLFDDASLASLTGGAEWSATVMKEIREWAYPLNPPFWLKDKTNFEVRPRTTKQIRETLAMFLTWGLEKKLKCQYPFIPPIPLFQDFINSRPWSHTTKNPSSKKRIKQPIRTKKV